MPELRKDPILGRWVIISSDRGKRPSDFTLPQENKAPWFEFTDGLPQWDGYPPRK